MADAKVEAVTAGAWSGGAEPYAVKSKKLGMWLFIISDALTFSALLVAYSYVRVANKWPTPFEAGAVINATVMTFVLLSSSVTMVLAVSAAHRGLRSLAVKWIGATMLGGVLFDILHGREWLHLIEEGVTPFGNPWGVPLFGASFFTLTGLHMLHVTCGVIYLGVVAAGFGRGKFESLDVEVSGLYWHFVDLVWMFIFPLVYLMSNRMI
ncbi:MAG: cytochrome c oxidase subunit 3 [Acidobacteria bacterium]|nr:cytochrome c oxidase subunit 3 [Acidobacteriota bacterium]